MRFLSKSAGVAATAAVLVLLPAMPALAAETAASELVIIPAGESVEGDLYAAGVEVIIEGVVDGDLIAFAAEEVSISGEVTGSVTAIAPSVNVSGTVGGSLRVSTGQLTLDGAIERDVVATVVNGDLAAGSRVGGDVLAWAVEFAAAGAIGGDLEGTQRTLRIEGSVGGDVDVTTGNLTVTGPLEVSGDLGYRSRAVARGMEQSTVGGVVAHESPLPPNIRVRALGLLARILTVLSLTTAALLVAWGWPERTRQAGQAAGSRPLKAWTLGAPILFSPLLLAAIAALLAGLTPDSASLPLIAIFVPLILVALVMVLLVSLVAGVPAVSVLGWALPGKRGINGSILLGSVLAGLTWMIPWVGWLVPLLVLPIGLGAWMLSFGSRLEPDSAQPT